MKKTFIYVLFFIMALIIALLGILLFSSQNTVKQQKLVIVTQDQKIKTLEAEVEKLSAITPENILRIGGNAVKEKGMEFINKKILSQ